MNKNIIKIVRNTIIDILFVTSFVVLGFVVSFSYILAVLYYLGFTI